MTGRSSSVALDVNEIAKVWYRHFPNKNAIPYGKDMKATVLAATKLLEHKKFVAETFQATGGNLSISKMDARAILKRVHELTYMATISG